MLRLRDQVKGIAGLLQDKASIPMIQAELPLILDLQTDEWWQNVTVPMLENCPKTPAFAREVDREKAAAAYLYRF